MHKTPFVSFIGAGNLAWHLAPALDNAGFPVREVYSRHEENAAALVDRLYEAEAKDNLDFSSSKSGIFIIAVKDDAIRKLSRKLVLPDHAILLHTSGSMPLSILDEADSFHKAVFYPLQTFTKEKKIDFKDIPIFVETGNDGVERLLITMGKAISKNVTKIDAAKRRQLHLAAVFASNFTNHMLFIAKHILKDAKLGFEVLHPLIVETLNKSLSLGPEKAQTGPARRGDLEILDQHMESLKDDEQLAEIYKYISQHIIDNY